MKLTIVHRAEENERFASTAFDSQIGKDVPIRFDTESVPGRVVAAQVSPDGTEVTLTIDVPETAATLSPVRLGEWSIRVPEKPFSLPADWRDHL